jgi:hypothetical protein
MLVLLLASAGWSGWRPIGLVALIVLGNCMVPAVEIMPLQALLVLTALHQLVFLSLAVAIVAVSSRRAAGPVALAT